MNETLFQALTLIIPLVFAIVFHEVAHGYVAKLLGDPTAQDARRLTLNPLRHVDPIGTVVLPGLLALAKAPVFGWAKPVPVNKFRLKNPRRDMMLVAAAGPGSNLIMAGVAAVAIVLVLKSYGAPPDDRGMAEFIFANLSNFLTINIFLALFNLLPIPPFDGSHILEGLLPRELAKAYGRLQRYGFALVIVLLIVIPWLIPSFNPISWILVPPFEWLTGQYLSLAARLVGI